ncbi:MAG: AsmA family protein [Rhodopila sp.]
MNRTLRISLLAAAGGVALAATGIGIALATFNPNILKPRIAEAVHRATGRELTIAGDIRLHKSLWPTVEVNDVSLSNPAGFSRPQMATLKQMRLSLALLPLLSREVQIASMTLVQPDILLEHSATGLANWRIAPPSEASAVPSSPSAPSAPRKRLLVGIETVGMENGVVAYRDDASGRATSLDVPILTITASSRAAPLHIEGSIKYLDVPVALTADTGGLAQLQDPSDTAPWPVRLALSAATANVTAEGTISAPAKDLGYDLAVKGSVADSAALSPLVPNARLPSLRGVSFAFTVTNRGQGDPEFKGLTLHTGPGELGNGVALSKLDLAAASLDQPIKLDVAATVNGAPLSAAGSVGSPLRTPIPVDLALRVSDEPLAVKASVAPAAGGYRNGVALRDLTMSGPQLDLGGDVTLSATPRPSVVGTVNASRVNLDGLIAAADKLTAATPAAPPPGRSAPAPERPAKSDRIFPDTPLPFDQLRTADADLRLTIGSLRTSGQDYRKIATHVVLSGGRLNVDPVSGEWPEGRMDGAISVDASQAMPPVKIRLHAPGLALRPLLAALRQPPIASGNLEIYANLSGAGVSPHAIASTLNGSLGLVVPGGTIDNRLLGSILGQVMNQINALDLVGRGGSTDLRCFAARIDAHQGIAEVRNLDLSSSLATVTGDGTLNLGAETMNLRLRPEARLGGNLIVIPVQLSGPMRKPVAKVNEVKSVEANAATIAGAVLGNATPLGAIGGLLGTGRLLGGGDACPAALATARGQAAPAGGPAAQPGPAPAQRPAEAGPRPPIPNPSDPTKALRNLLR